MQSTSQTGAAKAPRHLPITRVDSTTILSIVESGSRPGIFYTVKLDTRTGKGECGCPANVECYHVKALRLAAKEQGLTRTGREARAVCADPDPFDFIRENVEHALSAKPRAINTEDAEDLWANREVEAFEATEAVLAGFSMPRGVWGL